VADNGVEDTRTGVALLGAMGTPMEAATLGAEDLKGAEVTVAGEVTTTATEDLR
jgi:hypothetical protein